MTLTDTQALDESIAHHCRSARSLQAQGHLRMAEVVRAKIDALLDQRLALTKGEQ